MFDLAYTPEEFLKDIDSGLTIRELLQFYRASIAEPQRDRWVEVLIECMLFFPLTPKTVNWLAQANQNQIELTQLSIELLEVLTNIISTAKSSIDKLNTWKHWWSLGLLTPDDDKSSLGDSYYYYMVGLLLSSLVNHYLTHEDAAFLQLKLVEKNFDHYKNAFLASEKIWARAYYGTSPKGCKNFVADRKNRLRDEAYLLDQCLVTAELHWIIQKKEN
jgi:hypothetical protein